MFNLQAVILTGSLHIFLLMTSKTSANTHPVSELKSQPAPADVESNDKQHNATKPPLPSLLLIAYLVSVVYQFIISIGSGETIWNNLLSWNDMAVAGIHIGVALTFPFLVIHLGLNFPNNERVSKSGWMILNALLHTIIFSCSIVFAKKHVIPPGLIWLTCGLCPAVIVLPILALRALRPQKPKSPKSQTHKITITSLALLTTAIAVLLSTLRKNAWGETLLSRAFPNCDALSLIALTCGVISLYYLLFHPAAWVLKHSKTPWRDRFSLAVLGTVSILFVSLILFTRFPEVSLGRNLAPRILWLALTFVWLVWIWGITRWPGNAPNGTPGHFKFWQSFFSPSSFALALLFTSFGSWWIWDYNTPPPKENEAQASINFGQLKSNPPIEAVEAADKIQRTIDYIKDELSRVIDIPYSFQANTIPLDVRIGQWGFRWVPNGKRPEDGIRTLSEVLKNYEAKIDQLVAKVSEVENVGGGRIELKYETTRILLCLQTARLYLAFQNSQLDQTAVLVKRLGALSAIDGGYLIDSPDNLPLRLSSTDATWTFDTTQHRIFLTAYLEYFHSNITDLAPRLPGYLVENINQHNRYSGLPLLPKISCRNFSRFGIDQISAKEIKIHVKTICEEMSQELQAAPWNPPSYWATPTLEDLPLSQRLRFTLSPGPTRARMYAEAFVSENRTLFESFRSKVWEIRLQVFDAACQLYQIDKGKSPTSWDDLCPALLPKPINSPKTNKPFEFPPQRPPTPRI